MKRSEIKEEHMRYLDLLCRLGRINMYGAAPYLMATFTGMKKDEADEIVLAYLEDSP